MKKKKHQQKSKRFSVTFFSSFSEVCLMSRGPVSYSTITGVPDSIATIVSGT